MKHAYLIMAHNEFEILQYLVDCIDDARNTIYIHFDRKVVRLPNITTKYSHLYILKDRVDVRWGHTSQIIAELNLFRTALSYNEFAYFHLISGVHLPLYTQDYLHQFFNKNPQKSYLMDMQTSSREVDMKMKRYNFFIKNFMHRNAYLKKINQLAWHLLLKFQDILGISRNEEKVYKKASQWVSLSLDAVKYIVLYEKRWLKLYKYMFCSDEFFIRSELEHSSFRDSIIYEARLLKCDFEGTSPKVYSTNNYSDLMKSNNLFARKFSGKHIEVVQKIVGNLKGS